MIHRYSMPFGAQTLDDGGVRFRLWAPAAKSVTLCLQNGDEEDSEKMTPLEGGWFETTSPLAGPGSRYRYCIDDNLHVPDPASRFNPEDVHGHSEVIDPAGFEWQDSDWLGRPWHEAVFYELHVGTFSETGDFKGVEARLEHLAELGITAIELMPVADFPGSHNWGYDGVLPFAPDSSYGRPEDLKSLVQAAHAQGLMVFLDVVYNHFGPEGNYLHAYAPDFFTDRHHTPWGDAINFDGDNARTVRDFFIHNALYWLEEYHLDGLRLDAVHAIMDDSNPDILCELAEAVRKGPGELRHIHLVLENDNNIARYLVRGDDTEPVYYNAQWNDDIHHAFHLLLTGESDGYYSDYSDKPLWYLGRCLTEGFAYQGEMSGYRHGDGRGEPSKHLPPQAFISLLQNHDQVGNRAFGERLSALCEPAALRMAVEILLLAPSPPLLFMGEEWQCRSPFLFFCDFEPGLAEAVTAGRRKEFARFERFSDPAVRERIPDPAAHETLLASRLNWDDLHQPDHQAWLRHYQQLLALRHQEITPCLARQDNTAADYKLFDKCGLLASWRLDDGCELRLLANAGDEPVAFTENVLSGRQIYASPAITSASLSNNHLPPWSVLWFIHP